MLAEDTGTAAIDGALLRRLLRYLRPYWLQATLALVLLLVFLAAAGESVWAWFCGKSW